MSYEKTTWANGDTITAEKLNNIENGIEATNNASILMIEMLLDGEYMKLNKKWQEIFDHMQNGGPAFVYKKEDKKSYLYMVDFIIQYITNYEVTIAGNSSLPSSYSCQNADDYPKAYLG